MTDRKADIKPDIHSADDRGESIGLMEPMLLSDSSRYRPLLADAALELAILSASFRSSLPAGIMASLADLVRSMNCYYSNLIEGHDTHPIDIERALNNDYSADLGKRNLQLEAKAHIDVQAWIDRGGLAGRATAVDGLLETHRRFCEALPDDLLWVSHGQTGERYRMTPGTFRQSDVSVGRLVAVSPGAVPRFMTRFEQAYARPGRIDAILGAATAHHRLLWIHPFVDGNGRVARLMAHAMLLEALDTGAVWSVARGLARNEKRYKDLLMACDLPKRNDLDGRGHLSEEALAEFVRFFLETCIDQIRFMQSLVEPNRMRGRILGWAKTEIQADRLPFKSDLILEALLYRGILSRADIPALLGTTDRQARRVTAVLLERGILATKGPKADFNLAFPAALASSWMPGLFPA
jgi:Fic family protein